MGTLNYPIQVLTHPYMLLTSQILPPTLNSSIGTHCIFMVRMYVENLKASSISVKFEYKFCLNIFGWCNYEILVNVT
jgi:hypothetical protein